MREVGGYFGLEAYGGPLPHDGCVLLDSGRSCLAYLAELRRIRRIWLPDWLCSSVYGVCAREGVAALSYPVGPDMLPDYGAFRVGAGEWLYLVDYYGRLGGADVAAALDASGGRLVVDESQGLLRPPWAGADTLYTCRKWVGVADGALLATSDGAVLERGLPRSESGGRMDFVLGRAERTAAEFYPRAVENNRSFRDTPPMAMSAVTESLLRAVDWEGLAERRRENWKVLDGALGSSNALSAPMPDVPFMYPYLADGAGKARGPLAGRGVYVPTLWPDLPERSGEWARLYSADVLPLPLDQRYGADDMEYVLNALGECL